MQGNKWTVIGVLALAMASSQAMAQNLESQASQASDAFFADVGSASKMIPDLHKAARRVGKPTRAMATAALLQLNANADAASTPLAGLPMSAKDANLSASAILEKLYNDAKEPAQVSDFDVYGEKSNQKCVAVMKGKDDPYPVAVKRIVKVTPGNGPLFPGKREEKIFSYTRLAGYDIMSFFDQIVLSTTPTELVEHLDQSSAMLDTPFTARYRKNSGLIASSWAAYDGTPEQIDGFSYCYREP